MKENENLQMLFTFRDFLHYLFYENYLKICFYQRNFTFLNVVEIFVFLKNIRYYWIFLHNLCHLRENIDFFN